MRADKPGNVGTSATIRDVAAAAGVSPSTVSRAFSSPDLVNPRTRARVLDCAESLGYIPSRTARASDAGSAVIGLIVPDVANPSFPPIIKAVQARARRKNRVVLLADTDEHADDEVELAQMLSKQVDGLIIVSARMPESRLPEIRGLVPVVFINRKVAGSPCVLIDNAAGMHQAVQHLAALGHTQVCYLNGPRNSWANRHRRTAVRTAAQSYGMKLVEFGPFEPQIQAGVGAADLVRASDATAVIAYDDVIALGLMSRLAEHGLRTGREVSVIGVDDSPIVAMAHPTLTTVHMPGDEAGRIAIDVLVDILERNTSPPQVIQLETRLVIRGSTGPAPEHQDSPPRRDRAHHS